MYAIVALSGRQYKVEAGQEIYVNRLAAAKDEKVEFDKVLLVDNDGDVKVGSPYVDGVTVKAIILAKARKLSCSRKNAVKAIRRRTVTGSICL